MIELDKPEYRKVETPHGDLYISTKKTYSGFIHIAAGNRIETRNKKFKIALPHKIILLVQRYLLWRAKKTNTQYVGLLYLPYVIGYRRNIINK